MKRILLIVLLFIICNKHVNAQSSEELQSINNKARVQFVTPEALDQLMINLRKFESNPVRDQDSLLLDTYKVIASSYMSNNHFKQAYEVYNKYIFRKENMLAADRSSTIGNAVNSVFALQQKDEQEEKQLQNDLNKLKSDNESLSTKKLSFKSNFTLTLVILTSLFAIMLASAWIKMVSLRGKLQQNRDRMKSIHRFAVTGNFSNGILLSMKSVLRSTEMQLAEIKKYFKKQDQNISGVKNINEMVSVIEKKHKEISEII